MDANVLRTKSIEQLVRDAERGRTPFQRTLTATDLMLLGIGATIGTGIFLLTGTAAARDAGPAIVLSYAIAGVACALAALCYAELAAVLPISGSAYTYAYATLGELFAWMIGWDLMLEYALGSITVAVGWSFYVQRVLAGVGVHLPVWMTASPNQETGSVVNAPAVAIVCGIAALLVIGVRQSARVNALMVAVKLAGILVFIAVGAGFVSSDNWSPFMPYGWSGVFLGASVVFFAYVGFDAVSTTAEEAKDPAHDVPKGIIASLLVCTVLYLAVAAVLSGVVPVVDLQSEPMFLSAPVAYALSAVQRGWAAGIVSIGALAGMTSVLLVMLMSQPRVFFAMSRDGLLPDVVSRVHPRFRTPYVTTIITCVIVALAAGFAPIEIVGELTSIGTLFAFVIVSLAVIVLRVKRPDARRPFKAAGGLLVPILGALSCVCLMFTLSVMTWVRFLGWLDIGLVIYWFYGRTHSPLVVRATGVAPTSLEGLSSFVIVVGALIAANGLVMAALGVLTEAGVTPESLTRWSELDAFIRPVGLHISARISDVVGLKILIGGIALIGVGVVLGRAARKP